MKNKQKRSKFEIMVTMLSQIFGIKNEDVYFLINAIRDFDVDVKNIPISASITQTYKEVILEALRNAGIKDKSKIYYAFDNGMRAWIVIDGIYHYISCKEDLINVKKALDELNS